MHDNLHESYLIGYVLFIFNIKDKPILLPISSFAFDLFMNLNKIYLSERARFKTN